VADKTVAGYAKRFASLRRDVSRTRWTERTRNGAPHKPLLLLSVLDLFEQGQIRSDLVELTTDLGELFTRYWTRIMPPDKHGNLALPFFHLSGDGFWHLRPISGKEDFLVTSEQFRSLSRLTDTIIGARLDHELYALLQVQAHRAVLRAVLIKTYFAPEAQSSLVEQGAINNEAFRYSELLLRRDHEEFTEALVKEEVYRPAARDQGFRRAIVTAYDHRCALCGIRMLTFDGHTAVDASHIKPWSLSRDDRPANGMALCKLCHWSFDEGLLGVSYNHTVLTSAQLTAPDNLPGYLSSLKGHGIVGPAESTHWPDPVSLQWHRKNVFRTW
jgi:putative restriction endonuclease